MAGKPHVQKVPSRLSWLGKTGPGTLLDLARYGAHALRKAIYVGPDGQGGAWVMNPEGGTPFRVPLANGGATFAPGSVVVLGSFADGMQEMLLSAPPEGFGGSAAFGAAGAYAIYYEEPVSQPIDHLAVVESTATELWGYLQGDPVAKLAETSERTLPIIPVVYEGRYLICHDFGTTLEVWDMADNVVASLEIDSGWRIGGAAIYGTTVYWIEVPTDIDWTYNDPNYESVIRLRSAMTDLSDPGTVESLTVSDTFHWEWAESDEAFAISESGVYYEQRVDDAVNHEVLGFIKAYFPYVTGASYVNDPSASGAAGTLGCLAYSGALGMVIGHSSGDLLESVETSTAATQATLWSDALTGQSLSRYFDGAAGVLVTDDDIQTFYIGAPDAGAAEDSFVVSPSPSGEASVFFPLWEGLF